MPRQASGYFRGERLATRLRFLLRTRFDRAVARFTLDRLDTFRLERFPRLAAIRLSSMLPDVAARAPRG